MKSFKNPVILLAFALSVFMSSCTSKPKDAASENVKHFRHLQFSETSFDIAKGSYPITAEEAKTINNYTFTYNEDGKPVSIVYMRGDQVLGYSEMGFARLEVTFTDSTEVHRFFDKESKPVESDGVYAFVYKLDKNGNRIGLTFLDKDGKPASNRNSIASYIWKVLPDGMVQEKRYNKDNVEVIMNPFCPFFELRFSYDQNGYCTRMANYMADTLYDCTAENCGEVGVSYFSFVNNDKGGLTQFSVFNSHGQMSNLYWGWSKFVNTLDENGNVTETFYWDQDNEPLGGKTNPLIVNQYDEHGSLVERKFLDKDRKLVLREGPKAAAIKFTYDEIGNPKDTTFFDAAMVQVKK
jgi:hypothetical protein